MGKDYDRPTGAANRAIDPATIDRLRRGDARAFESIFLSLHERVFRFALTYTKQEELSKEITQEAFIQLWVKKEKMKRQLCRTPGGKTPGASAKAAQC